MNVRFTHPCLKHRLLLQRPLWVENPLTPKFTHNHFILPLRVRFSLFRQKPGYFPSVSYGSKYPSQPSAWSNLAVCFSPQGHAAYDFLLGWHPRREFTKRSYVQEGITSH